MWRSTSARAWATACRLSASHGGDGRLPSLLVGRGDRKRERLIHVGGRGAVPLTLCLPNHLATMSVWRSAV